MHKLFHPQLFKQVIIGTKSKSRRSLFESINLNFQYQTANIDEKNVLNLKNDKYDALKIAIAKADFLSKRNKGKIIVTFDTTILFNNKTVYKCSTPRCCIKLLNSFSHKTHYLYTGMVFMADNKIIKEKLSETKITFKNNHKSVISKYVKDNFNQIKSAVGCYNIESTGRMHFHNITNSYFNVLGIDIINFLGTLRKI